MPEYIVPKNVQGMPPTTGIKDPAVRAYLDALQTSTDQRAGSIDMADPNRYITKGEFNDMAGNAIAQAFSPGVSGGAAITALRPGGGTSVTNATLIDNLANWIRKSLIYQKLETQIAQIDISGLTNGITTAISGIKKEETIRNGQSNAMASAINTIWAAMGGSSAVIQDGALASVTPSAVEATKWTQVQTALKDPNTGNITSTSLKQEMTSYANSANNTFNSIYSVRAQVGVNGQTLVGGFGLSATTGAGSMEGPRIDFAVRADTFAIGATAATPDAATQISAGSAVPFMVLTTTQNVNGVPYPPGVYMKKVVIGDASVDTLKIGGNSVTVMSGATVTNFTTVSIVMTVTQNDLPYGSTTVPVIATVSTDVAGAGTSYFFDAGLNQADLTQPGNVLSSQPPSGGLHSISGVIQLPVGTHTLTAFNHGAPNSYNALQRIMSITAVMGKR